MATAVGQRTDEVTQREVLLELRCVRSWAERREAERVAWLAPGLTDVENRVRL